MKQEKEKMVRRQVDIASDQSNAVKSSDRRIILNPNKELVEEVRRKLKENDGYCPCKLLHIEENKCMCKEFREQMEGECHCGLYVAS